MGELLGMETAWHGTPGPKAIVLLHEGLGSVSAWRDFPARLHEKTRLPVFVYSRYGYGASRPVTPPRPLDYMHVEGREVLPALLEAAAIEEAFLVGHSDGGSIAIVYAGSSPRIRLRGLALLAAHVFCEDLSVRSIAEARDAYEKGDLRARLAKHHRDVDGAFWGWNRAWLDPGFRAWNLESFLPSIQVPTLVIQGRDDPYGTLEQVHAIERGLRGDTSTLLLSGCGHAPHRERPIETLDAIARLVTM
ncbi:MAG: alpha/beta fold hydrolase [Polyangiales bacterium]